MNYESLSSYYWLIHWLLEIFSLIILKYFFVVCLYACVGLCPISAYFFSFFFFATWLVQSLSMTSIFLSWALSIVFAVVVDAVRKAFFIQDRCFNFFFQKRLLCLALQVITRPIAIFLDEPITGTIITACDLDMTKSMTLPPFSIFTSFHYRFL